jgi:RNA exonuclease 4
VVGVGPGGARSVLARVAIVDFFGRCLLDEFVRVEERVTDYRHHITGISEKDLSAPKAISYGQCRRAVIEIIRGKILVGHALQNDLQVLGIHHPWHSVRDTATHHKFMKRDRYGRTVPSRLRDLAAIHLHIEIQRPGRPHCPLEDACATMALYRKSQAYWDCEAEGTIPPNLRYPMTVSHGPRTYH